jgi:hypothetical protein
MNEFKNELEQLNRFGIKNSSLRLEYEENMPANYIIRDQAN